MKRITWIALLLASAVLLLAACSGKLLDRYQVASEKDGSLTFLDKRAGKVYYVNKSGNIVDVVDLAISEQSIQNIKDGKEQQDKAQKNRDLGQQPLPGTKFTLSLQTRYYKDRLLYRIQMKPYDETAAYKASTIRVDLVDAMGFTLEKIEPPSWYSTVDEKGTRLSEDASGELPMTLDNYIEVNNWNPTWRF